ncbi:twin-argninine leader-binding protein DmsD [Pasteurella multocida subsp. multocida str. Anand1_cattle]|nr:twin-argninine leader-binding protein DmsD [Pasteurella multocida subsp. multocida str. Anand1_cattle]
MPQRQWVSLSGRLLGALFYYAPTEAQLESILDFFRSLIGNMNGSMKWMQRSCRLFSKVLQLKH